MNDRAIARWRLHTMRLSGRSYPSPTAVVDGLLAVQAENLAQASWAVATRSPGVSERRMQRLLDDGAVLRTHVLRSTWHFVRPEDIRWLVELTAPRIRRVVVQHQQQLGIDDDQLDAAAELVVAALDGGFHLTRAQLGERLRDAGLPAEGQGLGLIMAHLELSALVCSGAAQGRSHTYALLEERAPRARRLDRDEALAELALRYVAGHGPVTERDLAYWATMTLADVRAGLAAVADHVDSFEHDGRTYWFADEPPSGDRVEPRAHLLQILDEYHHGYQDSRHVLDADGLVPGGRAASMGMTLVDGQMVGDMRRSVTAGTATFEVGLFRDLDADERAEVAAAAERYGEFLGLDAVVLSGRS